MKMIFYDFEVTMFDWLVVFIDTDEETTICIKNSKESLEDYYSKHRNDIWVGFNSRHYDQWILKAILAGFDAYEMNEWIITKDKPGWAFSSLLRAFPLNNYDVMGNIDRGLKVFEGFMGNSIKESSVPFDIARKLTFSESNEMAEYCKHDVEQTIEVFLERISDFEAQMGLIKMFNLPLSAISKTKVQLSAEILEANKRTYNDEFDISFPSTLNIKKYQHIVDWYKSPENRNYKHLERGKSGKMLEKKTQLKTLVAGVPHVFGWGGVHGAREKYFGEGYFINMDVASLYPNLMINYNLHSRSCNPEKFNDIVATRLKYKAEKNPLQAPLKIVINGTYGAMKDKNNPLYDPRQANNVCVYGQLLLLDLIEHLEEHCEIIQSNTDGVLIKMPDGQNKDKFYSLIDDIAYEWESRTGLNLEFDEYVKVFQKDVNNYVIVDIDGKYKSKGAYVKKLSALDYDLPIVNKALIEYMVHGVPVEKTISKCKELKEFQMVKKISNKYEWIEHGNKKLNEKTVRCFASLNKSDGGLRKLHSESGRYEKIEGTPEHCFLYNDDVNHSIVPPQLDLNWYIETAKKRLTDFGVL